jgi:CO/xanthine dehydrogenase FAD-binding subunit
MKPAAFDYVRAGTVEEALAALASHGDDAKLLAGGQSLVPMMNFRLARPTMLVDLNGIDELQFVRAEADGLRIGAMTRHHAIETSSIVRTFPVLAAAAAEVGHLAIRNRGTFGGALAHNDPAAEFPMIALLLDAKLTVRGPKRERVLASSDFLIGPLTSALEAGEILTSALVPWLPAGAGWGFEELSRRHGDFAIAAAAAVVTVRNGRCDEARISLGGVGPTAFRAVAAERLLDDRRIDERLLEQVAAAARDASDPVSDIHGTADFRRHLAGELTKRVVSSAWRRASQTKEREA